MSKLAVQLPESLKPYVDAQVSAGGFASADEYVRALIEAEQKRQQRKAGLRAELERGLQQSAEGDSAVLDMAAIKAEGRRRLGI
ncbi:MAG: type II toxin-antitoxin system ParD family antitoxin [Planctomycetota bacterium]|nr:type II toxin-antitoxin system ParD family antitoxin [Planctomycetota bacterium]